MGVGLALMTAFWAVTGHVNFGLEAAAATPGFVPFDDAVTVEAGGAYLIDVLANDAEVPAGGGDRLLILVNPACGVARRVDGKISYSIDIGCSGAQILTYCVPSGDSCPSATLAVTVIAAPGQVAPPVSGDPTLTAGAPPRQMSRSGAMPRIAADLGDDDFGLPALASLGMGGPGMRATAPGVGSAAGSGAGSTSGGAQAASQIAVGRAAPAAAAAQDDATPALPAIAPVSAPREKRKPREKPRSIYASPALSTPSVQRPRLAFGAAPEVDPLQAGLRAGDAVASAPAARVLPARPAAADRVGPDLPRAEDTAPDALVTSLSPRMHAGGLLSWNGDLADRDAGVPESPFISQLAEFREIVPLSAAPEADWTLPQPGAHTRVAALVGVMENWAYTSMRDDLPAARPTLSAEPLAGMVTALPPIEPPAGFYRMVSLDAHSRHLRLPDPFAAAEPTEPAFPVPQAREATEPLPAPLAALTGRAALMALTLAEDAAARVAAGPPAVAGQAAAVARSAAAALPPIPRREGATPAQLREPTEPTPVYLARLGATPATFTFATPQDGGVAGVAFAPRPALAAGGAMSAIRVDRDAIAAMVKELSEPLPPSLAGWTAIAAAMPPQRLQVSQTISGARNVPGQARRNFQVLSIEGAQSLRLVLLDQRPGDLDRAERTEPLPANLRRLRTFPPLLSQRVRMTPDFYGTPRMSLRVRRYEELASPGIAGRPATAFEREISPRYLSSDPNSPSVEQARVETIAAGREPAPAPVAAPVAIAAPAVIAAATPNPAPAPATPADTAPAATIAAAAAVPAAAAPAASPNAAPGVDCPVRFSAFPALGAMIKVSATSPCRAGRVAVLHFEDLRIALRFDAAGVIDTDVPGAGRDHQLKLVTADGAIASTSITLLDSLGVERVALVWDDPVALSLHAYEFDAGATDEGHIWSGAPGDDRGYRRGANGLMTRFPALDGLGQSTEFYSFNPGRRTPRGRIVLAVEFASRRVVPQTPYCDADPLASPSFRVHRFDRGVIDRGVGRIFDAVPCGVALPEAEIYRRGLVQDILVVGR